MNSPSSQRNMSHVVATIKASGEMPEKFEIADRRPQADLCDSGYHYYLPGTRG
jgi:hypothetical protein